MTIPNILTLIRVVLIPFIVLIFLTFGEWAGFWAGVLFGVASFTDWADGYLARKWNQGSDFGAFLDPVADKLTVSVCLVLITTHYHQEIFFLLATMIIIGREIFISALREWMAKAGQSSRVVVDNTGKWKTAFQMFAIGCLLGSCTPATSWGYEIGYVSLLLAVLLTIWSMCLYVKAAVPFISLKNEKIG